MKYFNNLSLQSHSLGGSMKLQNVPRGCFLQASFIAILGIIVVRLLLPWEAIPYRFEEFLFLKGTAWEIFLTCWPIFAIGISLNVYLMARSVNPVEVHQNASSIPVTGFFQSLVAGLFEEIVFRWVLLYGFMGMIWFIDRITLRIFDVAALQVIANTPVVSFFVNFITSGAPEVAQHPGAWTIGFAAFLSNIKFQRGHLYLGIHGMIFSGIAGLYFFQLTFVHGLFAAIIVHFLFDMLVFVMLLIDILIERLTGHHAQLGKIYQWY